MLDTFLNGYESVLHYVAQFIVYTLELIGIIIVAVGSVRVLVRVAKSLKSHEPINVVVTLGRALAIALEFKLGAEIIKTVIVKDLRELLIIGMVTALRAVLAILIHWEIKNERADDEMALKLNEIKKENKDNKED